MKKHRFAVLIIFFVLFFIFLQIRILLISVFPDPRLKNDRTSQPIRGTIYDRYYQELAVSSTFYSLYARPSEIKPAYRANVRSVLEQTGIFSANELKDLYSNKSFLWIRRKLQPQDSDKTRAVVDWLKTNGMISKDALDLISEQGRIYPEPSTANIIGVVGVDNSGLSGIEYSLNSYLERGLNVQTTLDPQLSRIVNEELRKGIIESKAEFGSAVIIDNNTREILALVNFPMFDPNDYKSMTPYNLKLRATSDIFEPGSVMKQFSAAFALEKNLVRTNSPVYQCTGFASLGNHEFTDEKAHGFVNLSIILQKSCNIGMIQVADLFKKSDFYQFLRSFGFGQPVAVPLSENAAGILRPTKKWSFLSKYMISIGQEIAVTALQLGTASSVIAGSGVYKTPVLVRSITDINGKSYYQPAITNYRVLSEDTSASLLRMMETVVGENGTAIAARVEGVKIAGKTGTGQIAKENGSGYYPDLFNSVFVGYVPSNRPKYTVAVIISRPHGNKRAGGLVAAPVFANIIRRMIAVSPYLFN